MPPPNLLPSSRLTAINSSPLTYVRPSDTLLAVDGLSSRYLRRHATQAGIPGECRGRPARAGDASAMGLGTRMGFEARSSMRSVIREPASLSDPAKHDEPIGAHAGGRPAAPAGADRTSERPAGRARRAASGSRQQAAPPALLPHRGHRPDQGRQEHVHQRAGGAAGISAGGHQSLDGGGDGAALPQQSDAARARGGVPSLLRRSMEGTGRGRRPSAGADRTSRARLPARSAARAARGHAQARGAAPRLQVRTSCSDSAIASRP